MSLYILSTYSLEVCRTECRCPWPTPSVYIFFMKCGKVLARRKRNIVLVYILRVFMYVGYKYNSMNTLLFVTPVVLRASSSPRGPLDKTVWYIYSVYLVGPSPIFQMAIPPHDFVHYCSLARKHTFHSFQKVVDVFCISELIKPNDVQSYHVANGFRIQNPSYRSR